jgi:hypothetical protein
MRSIAPSQRRSSRRVPLIDPLDRATDREHVEGVGLARRDVAITWPLRVRAVADPRAVAGLDPHHAHRAGQRVGVEGRAIELGGGRTSRGAPPAGRGPRGPSSPGPSPSWRDRRRSASGWRRPRRSRRGRARGTGPSAGRPPATQPRSGRPRSRRGRSRARRRPARVTPSSTRDPPLSAIAAARASYPAPTATACRPRRGTRLHRRTPRAGIARHARRRRPARGPAPGRSAPPPPRPPPGPHRPRPPAAAGRRPGPPPAPARTPRAPPPSSQPGEIEQPFGPWSDQ